MALDTYTKDAIKAKLRLNIPPKDIANDLEVNVQTVYAINRKLEAELEDETVETLLHAPTEVIQTVVDGVKEQSKSDNASAITKQLDSVVTGVEGLKKLDGKFQATMGLVLKRFDEALQNEELALKEVKMISDTVADAYSKVFAQGTKIHIGDNNVSNQRLSVFKNKMGV